jgi:hypothetical protein
MPPQDHWLPGFNFNVEEWDATGQNYETLAIRAAKPGDRTRSIGDVVPLLDAFEAAMDSRAAHRPGDQEPPWRGDNTRTWRGAAGIP